MPDKDRVVADRVRQGKALVSGQVGEGRADRVRPGEGRDADPSADLLAAIILQIKSHDVTELHTPPAGLLKK